MAKKKIKIEGSALKGGVSLWRTDSNQSLRVWTISIVEFSEGWNIVSKSGLEDGEKVQTVIPITEGKNIGRSNETTPETQAIAEAISKIESKLKEGYSFTKETAGSKEVKGSGVPSPMLAQTYDPAQKQSGSKNLKKLGIENHLVATQPKLDGVRRLTNINKTGATMWTRSGDISKTLPHIEAELFELWKASGLEEIWLDGEAYTSELSFNRINGLTRKESNNPDEDLYKIKYHIYDIILDKNYKVRNEYIQKFKGKFVEVVPTSFVVAEEASLAKSLIETINLGYEGLMIRTLDTPYEFKRSKSLLKYKTFEDAEFKVVDVEESTIPGVVGAFILALDKPCKDSDGNIITTFKATPKCSLDEKKNIMQNKKDWMGEIVTVNYFGRSEYGVPRFGRVKDKRFDL